MPGFVNSKKGKGGGYTLARSAQDIRVGHIIRVLDGPLAPIQCASKTAYRRCDDCSDEKSCGVRLVMLEARGGHRTDLGQSDAGRYARPGLEWRAGIHLYDLTSGAGGGTIRAGASACQRSVCW